MSQIPKLALIDKPRDQTSFQALFPVKRKVGTKKVGHCGTLDKFASGLLILCIGKATKFVPAFTDMDKEYVADIRFGVETATLDPEGQIVAQGPIPTLDQVRSVLPNFLGQQEQIPPVYSAIHVDGKRAYQLARAGKPLEMAARSVRIDELELLSFSEGIARIVVRCSKGTYIRSLARDLGRACSSAASLGGLRRTRIGAFSVNQAVSPESFDTEQHCISGAALAGAVPGAILLPVALEEAQSLLSGSMHSACAARLAALASKNPSAREFLLLFNDVCIASYTKSAAAFAAHWVLPASDLAGLL